MNGPLLSLLVCPACHSVDGPFTRQELRQVHDLADHHDRLHHDGALVSRVQPLPLSLLDLGEPVLPFTDETPHQPDGPDGDGTERVDGVDHLESRYRGSGGQWSVIANIRDLWTDACDVVGYVRRPQERSRPPVDVMAAAMAASLLLGLGVGVVAALTSDLEDWVAPVEAAGAVLIDVTADPAAEFCYRIGEHVADAVGATTVGSHGLVVVGLLALGALARVTLLVAQVAVRLMFTGVYVLEDAVRRRLTRRRRAELARAAITADAEVVR